MNTPNLPNGARISPLIFYPSNWKSQSASVAKDWYCKYRFYDAAGQCKAVTIKGVNRLKKASQRRELLKLLVQQEMEMLANGWNPITKSYASETKDFGTWMECIDATAETLQMAETTRRDFNFQLNNIRKAAKALGYHRMPVAEVRKRHLKEILQKSATSPYSYNKQRAYLLMIYKEMSENEVVEVNLVKDISKRKTVKKIRETLKDDQRQLIDQHLQENYYEFWRYMQIFFHSGARTTELLSVKRSNVDLQDQRVKVLVKKRGQYTEVYHTIKDIALPFWEDLMKEPGEYLFSQGLKPGDKPVYLYYITHKWREWVKIPLGITADFYSLKHLHTSELVALEGDEVAAKHNAHTSTAMVKSIYDVKRKDREHERIKKAGNKFA